MIYLDIYEFSFVLFRLVKQMYPHLQNILYIDSCNNFLNSKNKFAEMAN